MPEIRSTKKGRPGKISRQGRQTTRQTLPLTPHPERAETLLLEVYDEVWDLAKQSVLASLDIRQDSLQSDALAWFRKHLGPRMPKLVRKIDLAVRAIDANANTVAKALPKVYVHRYISGGLRALAEFRQRNINLITSVPKFVAARAQKVLTANPNTHVRDLTKKIVEATDVTQSRARMWARDQTTKATAQVVQAKHESLGITEYIWRGTRDERERGNPTNPRTKPGCENHWILEGKRFKYSNPPIVNPSTGERANPGQPIECRCRAQAVLPDLGVA